MAMINEKQDGGVGKKKGPQGKNKRGNQNQNLGRHRKKTDWPSFRVDMSLVYPYFFLLPRGASASSDGGPPSFSPSFCPGPIPAAQRPR